MIYDKIKESMKTKSDYKEVFNFGLDENILIKNKFLNIHLYNNILYIIENKKITLIVSLFEEKYRLDYFNIKICRDKHLLSDILFEVVDSLYDCKVELLDDSYTPIEIGAFYDNKRVPNLETMVLHSHLDKVSTMCSFIFYEEFKCLLEKKK